MSQVIEDEMIESPGQLTPTSMNSPNGGPLPFEQPPKLKGRRRLLQSLQRMSSSPSLVKTVRAPSSNGYTGSGKGSMSCVSLASSSSTNRYGHSYGHSYSSTHSSAGFSTAPTSVASTPGPESQHFDPNARIVPLEGELASHASPVPRSIPMPADMRPTSKEALSAAITGMGDIVEDYFTKPEVCVKEPRKRKNFNFWGEMPQEIATHILQFLGPKEIVRCSAVSKRWHEICFDGQLWRSLDTEGFYDSIPASSLTKIMTKAGPFVRDLNLRGCAQMPESWGQDGQTITDACRNLEYFSLEGCRIDRASVHYFLLRNPRLVHINFSGMKGLNNSALRIISKGCQHLEHLNISWCQYVDEKGLLSVVQSCKRLKDLRAGEVKGFDDKTLMLELFNHNNLERLILSHCPNFDDESLQVLIQGEDPEIDPLTGRAIVPPRKLRHLDLSRCPLLTDIGVRSLAHNIPQILGLQLSLCTELTDAGLNDILESTAHLTHLDIEELDNLTNTTLQNLSKSPCASKLQHLNISSCENLGDTGMLSAIKACTSLRTLFMDNTRVSDLVLTEAAAQLRSRKPHHIFTPAASSPTPSVALHIVVYDCQNVTWTGVREILSRNTSSPSPSQIITLKCFYGYQDTVNEHTKRVLRGDSLAATRLERKWAEYMMATEEAGAGGAGARRRRRRLREAALVHADEEDGGPRGGRRRARSGGCIIM
ncbi:hypothetical protein MMC21_002216 [Puttea exsequens]|nr:hypothetical protein [Puttea exsequens]